VSLRKEVSLYTRQMKEIALRKSSKVIEEARPGPAKGSPGGIVYPHVISIIISVILISFI
jgi:hypothetical protein